MAGMGIAGDLSRRRLTAEDSPLRHVDLPLAAGAIVLAIYGLFMVYSATHRSLADFGNDPGYYLKRQGVFLVLGVLSMAAAMFLDYRIVKMYAPFFYAFALGLLVLSLVGEEVAKAGGEVPPRPIAHNPRMPEVR